MNPASLSVEQLRSLCKRGFGSHVQIASVEELRGGTFNTSYSITFTDQLKVVLRVAPPHTPVTYWEEVFLMRREHAMQPFFAPVAERMPRTLFIDFTHQIIERDYMFQSFIEGERWDDVADELTQSENDLLWQQFGEITKRIHEVKGESFGLPRPNLQFSTWSQFILERLERTRKTALDQQLEIPHIAVILDFVHAHPEQLDELQAPHLLHGDLWLFNILIKRHDAKPTIVGILDADRSWWGDPLADWTMFILRHAEEDAGHSHFWRAYGLPHESQGMRFRMAVYDAMHAATAFIWAAAHGDDGTVRKAQGTLSDVAAELPGLV